ncbi:MAG: FAD:protein FMN transferase [Pseudomonadota bacterium]
MTTRRRFLTILAGAGAGLALGPTPAAGGVTRWRGVALGARATIALAHPEAERLIATARDEIARLEAVFSLYREDSALMRLNRAGALEGPPMELVELLGLAGRVHGATGGAFDPTVQPLWRLHARYAAEGTRPPAEAVAEAQARAGFGHVRVSAGRVAFARDGMALTLNGIAQGYIADRVAALLAREGLPGALIETGEIRAIGARPDGTPWRVGLEDGAGGLAAEVALRDRAVATSAPAGTLLDAAGRVGHIIDPRTGRPGGRWRSVSVTAPSAGLADGLSTAFCLMEEDGIRVALARFPEARLAHIG